MVIDYNPSDFESTSRAILNFQKVGKSFSIESVLSVLPEGESKKTISALCVAVDHVGLGADSSFLNTLRHFASKNGLLCKSFPSMVASLEKRCPITILEMSGGAIPIEVLVSKEPYATSHVALSVRFKYQLNVIISSMELLGYKLPNFMRGSYMENTIQKVALAYFDVGDSRLEFIYKGK